MKKLIASLLIGCSLLFSGCGKTNKYEGSPAYITLTSEQLQNFLFKTNKVEVVNNFVIIDDAQYAVPTLQWVENVYTPQLKKFLFDNDLQTQLVSGYTSEENDCDKFATVALAVGHIMHYHVANKPEHTAMTIGEITQMKPMQDHAINFFIVVMPNGELALKFYEPQLQQFIPFVLRDEIIAYLKI